MLEEQIAKLKSGYRTSTVIIDLGIREQDEQEIDVLKFIKDELSI